MTSPGPRPVLAVEDLSVRIATRRGPAHVVNGVSWSVGAGETLAVVGESGSGKSVSVLSLLGLVPRPPATVTGTATFDGQDLIAMPERALQKVRGPGIGMVFQDPMTSLNPVLTVGRQLTEGMEVHLGYDRGRAEERAVELLDLVGIPSPRERLRAYPHHLSGGMRQRVMIAIALACEPQVLIADEATTALDVTIQAQILDAVRNLQERLGTATVWISHDLAVVGGLADNVVVMYGGQVLEEADVLTLFRERAHPYTEGLFAARPRLGADQSQLTTIPGSPPDVRELPAGCVFYDRCTVRKDHRCATERPELREISPGHLVRSFYTTTREAT